MHVDNDGWLVNDPGDSGTVVKQPRTAGKYKQDYGALDTSSGKPLIFVHHATGTYSKEGADSADRDGTAGMAKRVAAGNVQYYAHVYLGRDGMIYQNTPFTRAVPSVEGRFKFDMPPAATGKENNKIAAAMEWTGWGGSQTLLERAGITAKLSDRTDMQKQGGFYWQTPTLKQVEAGIEVTKAVASWAGMDPEAAFYGHKQIGSGAHGDPGPIITTVLDVMGRPALGLVPKAATVFFPFPAAAAQAAIAVARAVTPAAKAVAKTVERQVVAEISRARATARWARSHPVTVAAITVGFLGGLYLLLRPSRRSLRGLPPPGWPRRECEVCDAVPL